LAMRKITASSYHPHGDCMVLETLFRGYRNQKKRPLEMDLWEP